MKIWQTMRAVPLWLWTVMVLPSAFGVMLAWDHPSYVITSDSRSYIALAEQLRDTHRYVTPTGQSEITRVPGYPLFLAPWIKMKGFMNRTVIVQALAAVLTLILLWIWLREINGRTGACVGVALAALDLVSWFHITQLMSEVLFMLFVVPAGWLSWRALIQKDTLRSAALGGWLWGVATLVRPASYFLPALLTPLFWKTKRAMAIFFVMSYLFPGLWILRNRHVAGFTGLTAVGGYTLLRYPAASVEALRTHRSWGDTDLQLRQEIDARYPSGYRSDLERSQAYGDRAWPILKAHPWILLRVCLEGSIRILFGTGLEMLLALLSLPSQSMTPNTAALTGLGTISLWPAYPWLIPVQIFYMAFLLFLYGGFIAGIRTLIGQHRLREAAFCLALPLYFLLIASNQGYYRFRIPMIPFLAVGVAVSFRRRSLDTVSS